MSKPRTIAEYPNRADDYDEAVSKSHVQNTDTVLDEGGDHEVTAEDIRGHVDSTENPHQVTAGQVGAYTKGEVGDLLDDKADQSALNATNQAVLDLDGRVDTAEDEIQGLESSKADATNPIFSGNTGLRTVWDKIINRYLLTIGGGTGGGVVVELGGATGNIDATGVIEGTGSFSTTRNSLRYEFVFVDNPTYTRFTGIGLHNSIYSARPVSYTRDGETRRGIQFFGTTLAYYPTRLWFSGIVGQGQIVPNGYTADQVTDITPLNYDSDFVLDVQSPIITSGTVTATEFITTSRVESDRENALSALDNISEWKKKDGTIDYKKHYAYTPRIIKDEKGKVIEEIPGLGLEKRVAMLEKMVAELSGKLQNSKSQRK